MGNDICKVCGHELIKVGLKKVCSNGTCSYQELARQKWYEQEAANPTLWNEKIMENAPAIIAYEYAMLRKLLLERSTYGVPLKIKDLFEVIIKFPALILLSEALASKKKREDYNDIYQFVTSKLLNMGDWEAVAQKLIKKEPDRKDAAMLLLKDVCARYKKNRIVSWRNNNIGHGALKADDNLEFIEDNKKMLGILAEHFHSCEQWYTGIRISLKSKGQYHTLAGSNMARNVNIANGVPYVGMQGKSMILDPFIQYIDKGLYFFDSYNSENNIVALINYPSGDKKREKDARLQEIYTSLKRRGNVLASDASAEEKIYLRSQATTINKVLESRRLLEFTDISRKVKSFMSSIDGGIMLLQMENGMGKTTFVKMLDELSAIKRITYEGVIGRAYYINNIFSHSASHFVTNLSDVLRQGANGEIFDGDIPTVDVNASDAAESVANLINILFGYHQKYYSKKKLLLMIDGIDELPNSQGQSIIDLIPEPKALAKGIYILVTSRTNNQVSEYTKSLIKKLPVSNRIIVEKTDESYHELLEKYIQEETKTDKAETARIIELANHKFVNVDILVKAYKEFGFQEINTLPIRAEENFLILLQRLYGDRYFKEILDMLTVLTLSPIPLTVKQLSRLCNEDIITFKQLCYLAELMPFIDIHRTAVGNTISIQRHEIVDFIREKHSDLRRKLMTDWINTSIMIVESEKSKVLGKGDLLFVLVSVAIAIQYQAKETVSQLGGKLSLVIKVLLDFFQEHNTLIEEQLLQPYCYLYRNINDVLKECFIQRIKFDTDSYLRLMNLISERLFHSGDIQLALEKIREGLEILEENKAKANPVFLAHVCGKLAVLYSKTGQKALAEKYFNQSNQIPQNISNAEFSEKERKMIAFYSKAENQLNEVIHYKNRTRYDKALSLLDKITKEIETLEKSGHDKDAYVVSIKVAAFKIYGNIYKRRLPDKALEYMLMAQALVPATFKDDTTRKKEESDLLLNLGQVYRQLNEPVKAMQCYDESFKAIESLLQSGIAVNNELVCSIFNSKGNIERDLGNHQKSAEYYNQAIDYYEKCVKEGKQISETLYASCLASRSEAYDKLGLSRKGQLDTDKLVKITHDEELVKHNLNSFDFQQILIKPLENSDECRLQEELNDITNMDKVGLVDLSNRFKSSDNMRTWQEYLKLGYIHYLLNDLKTAVTCFEKVPVLNPEYLGVHLLCASCLALDDRPQEAMNCLQYLENAGYEEPFMFVLKANLLTNMMRFEEAIQVCEAAVEKGITLPEISASFGKNYYNTRQYDKAISYLTKVIEKCNYTNEYYVLRAACYTLEGQCENALSDYQVILANEPKNKDALAAEILILCKMNRFDSALAKCHSFIQFCGIKTKAKQLLEDFKQQALLLTKENHSKGWKQTQPHQTTASLHEHAERIKKLIENKQGDKAQNECNLLIIRYPDETIFRILRIMAIYSAQKIGANIDLLYQDCEFVLSKEPDNTFVRMVKKVIAQDRLLEQPGFVQEMERWRAQYTELTFNSDLHAMLQMCNERIKKYPQHAAAYSLRAAVYCDFRRYEDAFHDFRTYIALDGRSTFAYEKYSEILLLKGRFDEVIDVCEQGLVVDSSSNYLHEMKVKAKKWLKAKKRWTK